MTPMDSKGDRKGDVRHRAIGLGPGPRSEFLARAKPPVTIDFDQEVAKARDELRLGHLGDVIERLQSLTAADTEHPDAIPPAAIGSALTVLARALQAAGDLAAARDAYARALPLLTAAGPEATPQQETDLGAALIKLDRPQEAVPALLSARERQPEPTVETLGLLGVAYASLRRIEEAEEAFRVAIGIDPTDGYLRLSLAHVAAELGRSDAADQYEAALSSLLPGDDLGASMDAAEGLVALRPDDPSAMAAKGEVLRRADRDVEAIAWLESAVAAAPDYAFARSSLGAVLASGDERLVEALDHLDRALALAPDNAFTMYWRVVALQKLGRADESIDAADALLGAAGEVPDVLAVKSRALQDAGRVDEAVAVLQRLVELTPDDGMAHGMLSEVLLAAGRAGEALDAIDRAVELLPGNPIALGTRGTILIALDRAADAIEPLREASLVAPEDWLDDLVGALLGSDRAAEALEEVNRGLAAQPADVALLVLKGRVLDTLGQPAEAIEAFRAAVAASPSIGTWVSLSDALREAGRLDEALATAQNALDLDGDDAMALGTRGQALAALDRDEEALRDLRRATELDDGLSWAYIELADVLTELERYEEAAEAYASALRLDPDNPHLMLLLGASLRMTGSLVEAEELDRAALAAGADPGEARVELLEVLVEADKHQPALEEADAALAEDPRLVRALQLKGQVLVTIGRNEEALPVLDAALDLDPDHGWTHHVRAIALHALDRITEALAASERAGRLLPHDPVVRIEQASNLSAGGEWARAARILDELDASALSSWGDETVAWANSERGVAYWYVGRVAEAEQAFRASLEKDPSSIIGRLWLADAVRAAGRREDGDAIMRELIASAPKPRELDAADIANVGWAHLQLGSFDEAARLLAKALSKNPSLVWAQFDLALALLAGGAGDSGLREYERGIDQLRSAADVRQRHGYVAVALFDLEQAYPVGEARIPGPSVPPAPVREVARVRELLEAHLRQIAEERDRPPAVTPPGSAPEVA